jgi:hypothetical protein
MSDVIDRDRQNVKNDSRDRVDVLDGAKAISNFTGLGLRKTFRMLESGFIPADKHGRNWITTKERILAPQRERRSKWMSLCHDRHRVLHPAFDKAKS